MTDDGNAAQVRIVAHQLFEVWKAEQGKQRASWPAWVGCALGVFGVIFSAGILQANQTTAAADIKRLEARADAQDKNANQSNDRLARMETKLDLLLEKRK